MANFIGDYYSNSSYYPTLVYKVEAYQSDRGADFATYTLKCTVSQASSGVYGYDIYFNYNIGGVTGSALMKATSSGFPSNTGSFSVRVPTSNMSGGTNAISASAWSTSSNDSTHWQNSFNTGQKYLDLTAWNTPPVVTKCEINNSGTQWENTTTSEVTVNITDTDRNLATITIERLVDGSPTAQFNSDRGWTLNGNVYTFKQIDAGLGSIGEGKRVTYRATSRDSAWTYSGWGPVSSTLVKNVFTQAKLTLGNSGVSWGQTSIGFSYSGASNTNGNTEFKYWFTNNEGITIYNNDERASFTTKQIDIEGWGTTSLDRPYIKKDDLINYVKSSADRTKTLTLYLNTKNLAGTVKTSPVTLTISLKPNPTGGDPTSLAGDIPFCGGSYFVPSVGGTYLLSWSDAIDLTGGVGTTYAVQASFNNGEWYEVASGVMGTSYDLSADVKRYDLKESSAIYKARLIVYTSYGTSRITQEKSITLHYWREPRILIKDIVRRNQDWEAVVEASVNSSIAKITSVTWSGNGVLNSSTGITISTNKMTATGKIGQTGINANTMFLLTAKIIDNSGQSRGTIVTPSMTVPKYQPIISMREFGLGVNAFADQNYKFKVGGNAAILGYLNIDSGDNQKPDELTGFTLTNIKSLTLPNSPGTYHTVQNFGSETSAMQLSWYYNGTNILKFRAKNSRDNTWGSWGSIYTSENKPSLSDIGALGNSGPQLLSTGGNTSSAALTIQGTDSSGKLWCSASDFVIQSIGTKDLSLGRGNSIDMTFKDTFILANKYLGVSCPDASGLNSPYLTLFRNPSTGVRGGNITTGDTGTGVRLHTYNSNGDWASSFEFTETGAFKVNGNDVWHKGNAGSIDKAAPFISSLNSRLNTGWFAWSSNAVGRPTNYGVLININWGSETGDIYQIVIGSAGQLWTRCFINNAWGSWSLK